MNGDPENRSESGSEEEEHRHRQLANGIKKSADNQGPIPNP